MFEGLRAELTDLGVTPFDVSLPDEDVAVAPLEGALRLRTEAGRFELVTVDYGQASRLGLADTEAGARALLLDYLSRPLPPVRTLSRLELDTIVGLVALYYFDLRDRTRAAGDRGIVFDLPPQLPVDRVGALDGVHVYPVDTPLEFRSLPPSALRPENDVHHFLTTAPVRVAAVITPPWFGRPGGGIRFTLQQPETGLRDLVASGRLQRFQLVR